jgi:hypothetical protein
MQTACMPSSSHVCQRLCLIFALSCSSHRLTASLARDTLQVSSLLLMADEKLVGRIAKMPLLPALETDHGNQHGTGKHQQGRHDDSPQGGEQQDAGRYQDSPGSHRRLRVR